MQRGDIYFADLPDQGLSEQFGRRPVVIFFATKLISVQEMIVVVPLTTNLKQRRLPVCLFIPAGQGNLERNSVALAHQIRAVSVTRLGRKIGTLDEAYLDALDLVVQRTLGLK